MVGKFDFSCNDEIVSKLHSLTCSRQDMRNKDEGKNPTKGIGVVLAKDPMKVKLKNFYNSRVPELG